jgi:DNA ligase-1
MFVPMLADKFFDSSKNKEFQKNEHHVRGFVFKGTSGRKLKKKWVFSNEPTLYRLNPSGWFISEKRDGFRATWLPGQGLQSRSGKLMYAIPDWFDELMPKKCVLDGELFAGRNNWNQVACTIKRKKVDEERWKTLAFTVFDILGDDLVSKPFEHRYQVLKHVIEQCNRKWPKICLKYSYLPVKSPLVLVEQFKVTSMQRAYNKYKKWLELGGEGAVLRAPEGKYEHRRSTGMLKWKPVPTDEAVVVGYNEGINKLKGKLGTFRVRLENKLEFNLSGKISDSLRIQYVFENGKAVKTPRKGGSQPVIGDYVTFEFMDHSPSGLPRQPVYLGKREKSDLS